MKKLIILLMIFLSAHSYADNSLSGGISQFMIDRLQNSFEYSMIVNFLGNMKEEMEESKELRALLPETYFTLTRHITLSDPSHLDFSLFSLLKTNIHDDIINIVPNSIIYLLDLEDMEEVVMVVEEIEKVINRLNQLFRKIKQHEIHNLDAILINIKTIVEDMKKIKELNQIKEPDEKQRQERLVALVEWKKRMKILFTDQMVEIKELISNEYYKFLIVSSAYLLVKMGYFKDADRFVKKNFMHYTLFFNDLATAKTEDEVERVLEHYTLPVNSYLVKRNECMVTLNAYFGFGGGLEYHERIGRDKDYHLGLYAPVGFEFSWPTTDFILSRIFLPDAVFVSLLDFGTPISFRLKESGESGSTNSEIGWEQLFAPGVFLMKRVYKYFSLGVGGQYLRNFRETDGIQENTWRFSVFFAIDIPFFRFD